MQLFIMQRQLKFLNRSAVSASKPTCKQMKKMTVSNAWAAETGCTSSFLHTKTNTSTTVESYSYRETARWRRGSRKFLYLQLRQL